MSALLVALTVMLTWPQALYLGSKVADHDDPLFSMWRLAWVAHTLPTQPHEVFDANIFHPHTKTLAYSDAMFLESIVAAPWLWARVNPVLVYNLLLLGGIVLSGIAMFVLVRDLTKDLDAAVVSAVLFTVVPYRIEHFMHLELQWTMWMPLALWAVHHAYEEGSVRWGALAGLFVWLQVISCVYYGVFLGVTLTALGLLLFASEPQRIRPAILPFGAAIAVAAVLTLPYAIPYVQTSRVLGPREAGQIASFSAHLDSYVLTPQQNWLWGWTAFKFGGNELHLFPGIAAIALALLALVRARRTVWIYFALAALTVELSLGYNGALYRWLNDHVWILRGFRAPARFAILGCCALSVLAGFGFQELRRIVSTPRLQRALLTAVLVAIGLECGSAPMILADVPATGSDVYRVLRRFDRSVIVEFPMLDYDLTAQAMYQSTFHWHRLVNGYSGYEPPDYRETRERMRTFPDDASIDRLSSLGVRYVLIHEAFYERNERVDLLERMMLRKDLIPIGRFRDWVGDTQIFGVKERRNAHVDLADDK